MNPNSAVMWLPHLITGGLGHYVPDTWLAPIRFSALVGLLDGEESEEGTAALQSAVKAILEKARRAGYPCFLRTDLASAKHEGPAAYRVDREEDIAGVLMATVEDNESKFWLGGPEPTAVLVRRWLDLQALFTAFNGHPIAREWRFFVTPERAECSHFYWPEEAIREASHEDWRSMLRVLSRRPPEPDMEMLEALAVKAAAVQMGWAGGHQWWSVDFAQDRMGRWWLIDMALAEESWHPEHQDS